MPGRFSVRFFAVRRLPAVGIPVLKRAGPMVSPVFCLCGRRPGSVRCDDAASPPPLFFCRPVLPLRPAAPSCRSVLPLRPAAPSCRSVLPLRPAAPSCRSVLPLRPAALSFRLVLPPILLPLPAALSCCPVLPFSPSVSSCRPSYCSFLPLCLAALFCAPSCRSVLQSILLPCSAASFCRPTVRVRQDSPGRRMPFPPSSLGPGKIRLR